jgi:hypothetical protein
LTFLRARYILAVLLLGPAGLWAQGAAPEDPVAETHGLPAYVRLLPKPEREPWRHITPKERFQDYVGVTFSPVAALGVAAAGAVSQWDDSPKEWGQGWGAYGIRVASSYGSTLISNTVVYGASAALHEDTRYFRSTSDKFVGRLGHVIISPYVARSDNGHTRFSGAQFLGSASYSATQLAWTPGSFQGWDNIGFNYLIWYGKTAGVNFAKELYPSIARYYRNKRANRTSKQLASIVSESAGQR